MSTCAICVEDSKVPVCCIPCGHVYCQNCISVWQTKIEGTSKCPECREVISNVMLIYLKNDDSKENLIKNALAENTALKEKLQDWTSKNAQLEKSLASSQDNLSNKKTHVKNLIKELEDQQKKNRYKEQREACLEEMNLLEKSKKYLQERVSHVENERDDLNKKLTRRTGWSILSLTVVLVLTVKLHPIVWKSGWQPASSRLQDILYCSGQTIITFYIACAIYFTFTILVLCAFEPIPTVLVGLFDIDVTSFSPSASKRRKRTINTVTLQNVAIRTN